LWLFPEENLLPTTLFEAAAFRVILFWGGTSYQPLEQTLWVLAKIG
jgi:type IV secretory pathway VirB3-like protein